MESMTPKEREELEELKDALVYSYQHVEAYKEYLKVPRDEHNPTIKIYDALIDFYRRRLAGHE
ncbi:hypothetical protein TVAG_201780 [Trichomonas vaginalis G3]|uniref:Uncharacterized protein n=1 Tax=Trichomonas vaginalis (strain ATCC PRA-98 / G3) TaxID=412133 RepID=A2DWJ9_TRIV3|nr:hypothetical protein TVAGG3_0103680 [Trichomonas vaginalis G3]XP_001327407.1 hypothetical protein TVAGG3_0202070 [Trichomonas vaginalis G3]EAX90447.1 hypothetical protein TVAG_278680 [Trichomonas vaginalis G3]EAY15184.1 hypothetical protein TVAG_201780 [Trichomonas vaginalis G3]KAI5544510.1 hypothetical protein TVAGG3_0103680 [Trichomonas vaginalis G3]KAI5550662.1 hypothetical protein TVAGG3_0202070 [Trichomonas vaginalis G3]|eukprot:XP_001303377.1 hypothetical protein [Trichomonas vaginalis G3]